eukprot:2676750-Lingulodinium_polyedra.AAC.1
MSAGLCPCMACQNVTNFMADLVAHDTTGTLVTVAFSDASRPQAHSDHNLWNTVGIANKSRP